MRQFFVVLSLLVWTASALAQVVVPVTYRVTRTAAGQQTRTHTFPKSNMTCDLAPIPLAQMAPGTLRIGDPERDTRDCQWNDTTGVLAEGMVRELPYTFVIAGQHNAIDGYGPDSAPFVVTLPRIPQIPGAPASPRYVPPGTQTVAVVGTVLQRGGAFGLDVATTALDGVPNFPFYFGAATLNAPGYSTAPGDRFLLQLWKENTAADTLLPAIP